MYKLFEDARARLSQIADRNGDGKVDASDARVVINQLEDKATEAAAKWPLGTIITTAVVAGAIGAAIARALPC